MILTIFEKILNHYLQLDPATQSRLEKLAGKVVATEFRPLGWSLYFLFTQDGIHLANQYEGSADVTLQGALIDFFRLSRNSGSAAFMASNMVIKGDLTVANNFKGLFQHLDIDWEEQLSHVTGDIIAHQIGRFMRALSAWARQSSTILGQNLTEYVQEEARLFPPREELQDFFAVVDHLRDDVDRLMLRVERLRNAL